MFDQVRIVGPEQEQIVVQTRKGTNLTNFIAPEPELQHWRSYELLLDRYGQNWRRRKPATGGYNCAGHVWASRRTSLPDQNEWRLILKEDEYRRLAELEQPYPGDIVLYVEEPIDEIMHVARVVETRQGITPDSRQIPWAISKWDLKSGEVLHSVYDVPYRRQFGDAFSFRLEFWTDRPAETGEL